jgi:hypothetical protein
MNRAVMKASSPQIDSPQSVSIEDNRSLEIHSDSTIVLTARASGSHISTC